MRIDTQALEREASPSWVIVRPENITLGPAAESLANRYAAEVREALYIGDLVKYRCVTEPGDEFVVKSLGSMGVPLAPGARVTIGWRPEHCLAVAP